MFADAYATAIQSMNSMEARMFLSEHPELKVMLIIGKPDGSLDLQYFNGFPED
jgi:thiamine biosynthesis lipoprotein